MAMPVPMLCLCHWHWWHWWIWWKGSTDEHQVYK